jgi:2-polyprenyl-6-methoxyphenol hydroxylase-like FAD-dependent oxidoreductase
LAWRCTRGPRESLLSRKHGDFLRDFRGDTIHPSTLEILHELGVLDEFLKRPHREIRTITGRVGRETLTLGDFSHLPTRCKFVALMPQWDSASSHRRRGRTRRSICSCGPKSPGSGS